MEEELYTGIAAGGPLAGKTVASRRSGGILLVEPGNAEQDRRCWVYDWHDGKFICREPDGRTFDPDRHDSKVYHGTLEYEARAMEVYA